VRNPFIGRSRTVVVDLGRRSVRMAVAESAAEAVRFDGVTRIALARPKDSRSAAPLAGSDSDELVRRVRAEVERRGWRGMPAACLLSGSATSTQSFLLPPMPDADLRQAIALKLRETLHFDLEDACVDFRRVQSAGGEASRERVLTLGAAARRDAVMQAVRVLREVGLEPVAVGAAAESLANLSIAGGLCRENEASIHATIGSDLTILNLFDGDVLRFSREIDAAGEAFTQALMRPILTANGPVQLTHEQAEEVKRHSGYPLEGQDIDLPHGVTSEDILPLLEPVAQRISAELSRSMDYLCGLLGRASIDQIILSGPAGRMQNLDVMLEERLGVPVRFRDPVARAMAHWRLAIRDQDVLDPAGFSAILGYSLGNREPINLLPREERIKRGARRVGQVCRSSSPLTVGLGLALVAAAGPIHGTYLEALGSLETARVELDEALQVESDLTQALAQLDERAALVAGARGSVPSWSGVLKELSTILPSDVEITAFDVAWRGEVPTIDLELRIDGGEAPIEQLGARVVSALAASPFFLDVHVSEAALEVEAPHGRLALVLDIAAPPTTPWRAGP